MKLRFLSSLVLITSSLLLAGCSSPGKKTPVETAAAAEAGKTLERKFEKVGVVTLVNSQYGFVLIEANYSGLPVNLPLKTFEASAVPGPEGETAVLRISPERTGRFFVADIVAGVPGKGDFVYW